MNDDTIRALRVGAATGLRDVLRLNAPDLAWDVIDPLERSGDGATGAVMAGEVIGLKARGKHLDPIGANSAALAHEHASEGAA